MIPSKSNKPDGKFILFVCVTLCYICVCFAQPVPGTNLGDKCDISPNITGTCKLIKDCPRAEVKQLQYCDDEQKSLVCCPNVGEITEQQCVIYSDEVYVYASGGVLLINQPRVKQSSCVNEGTTFVSGGVEAKPKEFPHMALLGYGQEDNKLWLCGGALISNQYVLTAAHCSFYRKTGEVKWVRLGELNKAEKYDTRREEFNIEKFIKHPLYNAKNTKYNDIALILLDRQVEFSQYIRPACLNTINTFPIEKKMIATGWGSLSADDQDLATTLQKVALEQFASNECEGFYNKSVYLKNLPSGITGDLICAGDRNGEKDTCSGDSGGPLQIYHEKIYCMLSITGVTSFGKRCGIPGIPGIYTKVSNYVEWIENTVWI